MKPFFIYKATWIRISLCVLVLLLIVFYYNNLNLKSKSTHLEDKVNRISLDLNLMKHFLDDLKETTRKLNETLNTIFKLVIPDFFNMTSEFEEETRQTIFQSSSKNANAKTHFPLFLSYSLLLNNIFLCINHSSNIFIYTFTNPRFKKDLFSLFRPKFLNK